jgi:hypothetical protein
MKIETEHIERIRGLFAKMQTREDLLNVLNEANKVLYRGPYFSIPLHVLTKYANAEYAGKCYTKFEIKKKSGGTRQINAPVPTLGYLQRLLGFVLQCVFEPHDAAYGFVWNKSIVDNAKKHIGQRYVYNIDLKDFFSTVDQARVWKCLQLQPFNLNVATTAPIKVMSSQDLLQNVLQKKRMLPLKFAGKKRYIHTPDGTYYLASSIADSARFIEEHKSKIAPSEPTVVGRTRSRRVRGVKSSKPNASLELRWFINRDPQFDKTALANIIANICCTELEVERVDENGEWQTVMKRVLPQGAPTSPVLTNVVCQRLDHILTGVAKRFGLVYTRYADDITFSSLHNVYQPDSEFIKELHRVIADQGFHIKEGKTRLQKQEYKQEVTGLVVNEQVNVSKRYIKQIRMWLYYWETYGYSKAVAIFKRDYKADRNHSKPDWQHYKLINVLGGKIEYLGMVKGIDNEAYKNLKLRYDKLVGTRNRLNRVLNVWEKQGIDKAMELFMSIDFAGIEKPERTGNSLGKKNLRLSAMLKNQNQ